MEKFVDKLRRDYTHLSFKETGVASWSPHASQISYAASENETDIWSALHELGHALMGHTTYTSDIELVKKEAEAWDKATSVAKKYGITISEEHIQDCLDTYRDWLHKRSSCPACGNHGLQRSKGLYCCLNCQNTWKVSSARFGRPYRLRKACSAN
jgi:ribosomal protein L37AE/L43A